MANLIAGFVGGVLGGAMSVALVQWQAEPPASSARRLDVQPPARAAADLSPRLTALEAEVRALRRAQADAAEAPVPDGPQEAAPRPISQEVARAVEAEHRKKLNQRIAARQARDTTLIDALAEDGTVDSATAEALESIYFTATEDNLTALDDAENGRCTWDEGRARMQAAQQTGRAAVRELVTAAQYQALLQHAKKHATVLWLEAVADDGSTSPILGPR